MGAARALSARRADVKCMICSKNREKHANKLQISEGERVEERETDLGRRSAGLYGFQSCPAAPGLIPALRVANASCGCRSSHGKILTRKVPIEQKISQKSWPSHSSDELLGVISGDYGCLCR